MLLILAFCSVAAVAIFVGRHRQEAGAPSSAQRISRKMSAAFAADFDRIRAAEKIEDVGQRCLSYPDPAWLRWDREVIAAFCRSRSFSHISLDEIRSALAQGHPERVEQAFTSYLEDNYAKPEKRGILVRVYRELFFSSAPAVRDVVKQWVKVDPQSAFALAARGAYYKSAAEAARGTGYARDTPEESFEDMSQLAAKARRDLDESLRRSPRLSAAYDALIFVGRITSDHELIEGSIKAALALDPADERFYLDWMAVSEPRWGGSLEEMAHVDELAQQHVAANPLLKLVTEKKLAYYGDIELQRKDYAAALERFQDAFRVAPSPVDLGTAGYAASMLGKHEKAVWFFSQAYRFDQFASDSVSRRAYELQLLQRPDLGAESLALAARLTTPIAEGSVSQGDSYWAAGRFDDAIRAYEAALKINPRDKDALNQLATLYVGPLKSKDKAKPLVDALLRYYPDQARTWLLSAAVAGPQEDAQCLAALKQFMSLVDLNDPGEKDDIAWARAAIAKHEGHVASK